MQVKMGKPMWIGLYQISWGSLTWMDGSPLDYTNWLSGEPSHDENEHCIESRLADQKWEDSSCDDGKERGFICQIRKERNRDKFGWPCPKSGFNDFRTIDGETCFLIVEQSSVTYTEAEAGCVAKGAHLASLDNRNQTEFIVRYADAEFPDSYYKVFYRSMWIGMNSLDMVGEYTWLDGSPVAYTNFYSKKPDDVYKDRCVRHANQWKEDKDKRGSWYYDLCDETLGYYLCKTFVGAKPTVAPNPHTGNCQEG